MELFGTFGLRAMTRFVTNLFGMNLKVSTSIEMKLLCMPRQHGQKSLKDEPFVGGGSTPQLVSNLGCQAGSLQL